LRLNDDSRKDAVFRDEEVLIHHIGKSVFFKPFNILFSLRPPFKEVFDYKLIFFAPCASRVYKTCNLFKVRNIVAEVHVKLFQLFEKVFLKNVLRFQSDDDHTVPAETFAELVVSYKGRIILLQESFSGGVHGYLRQRGNKKSRKKSREKKDFKPVVINFARKV